MLGYKAKFGLLSVLLGIIFLNSCTHRNIIKPIVYHDKIVLSCSDCACKPSKALLSLLSLLKIEHTNTLESIVSSTQKAWLRPVGQERWQLKERFQDLKPQIMPLLKNMGLLDERHASNRHYRYAVVLGATYKSVKERFSFLLAEWQRGIRFQDIIFLGSERPLDMLSENIWLTDTQVPRTETEMMKRAWQEMELPKDLKAVPMKIFDTPMKQDKDGKFLRPNTGDTIKYWLLSDPKPGSVLAISNQPYAIYQDAVLRTYLPNSFRVETIGPEAEQDSIAVYLDNLARILYQEQQMLKISCGKR